MKRVSFWLAPGGVSGRHAVQKLMKRQLSNIPKKIILLIGTALVLGTSLGLFVGYDIGYEKAIKQNINSFDDCAKAGYPIQESFPAVCRMSDKSFTDSADTQGLQVCPDEWYEDRMPGPVSDSETPREYLIINGERREISEFDLAWIKDNCPVNQPQPLY